MNDEQKRALYRLVAVSYSGHSFTPPAHVWTGGEIQASHNFNHPRKIEVDGDRLTVKGRDNAQEWELVL